MPMLLFEDNGGLLIICDNVFPLGILYMTQPIEQLDNMEMVSRQLDYEGYEHELKEIHKDVYKSCLGVLEANFVEPTHDKQGFERTPIVQRLEHQLQIMQKRLWKDFQKKQTKRPVADVAFATEKRNMMHKEKNLYRFQNEQQIEHLHSRTF
ncbi:hypothetical protein SELMODRAFT_403250 [Selaginella moellendorffii]|uniref:Morc S5 domain-containing protein n=1 Tax=Selaginella moellendorffii TaxID=88036 RepID=D8QTK1_SELML|nr:hypothetical protein SELMODRAFT_403250 [Selaginella moellendorffii]